MGILSIEVILSIEKFLVLKYFKIFVSIVKIFDSLHPCIIYALFLFK